MVALNRRRPVCSKTILELKREHMIRETSAFLSHGMRHQGEMPRIPCVNTRDGGFSRILQHPGARALANAFWERLLGD